MSIYRLTGTNELIIDFKAMSSCPTPVSLCNHAYFNLAGHSSGSEALYDHVVQLNSELYTPVDAGLIPTGEIRNVKDTAFDLKSATRLGDAIAQVEGGGYDHNFVVNQNTDVKFNDTLPHVGR